MTGTEYRAWVEGLKVGDEVAIPSSWHAPSIKLVTRITATQIVVGQQRFSRTARRAGYSLGGTSTCIKPVTDAYREEIERAGLVDWLSGVHENARHRLGRRPTTAQLRAMREAHDAPDILDVIRAAADLFCENERCGGECDICQVRAKARTVIGQVELQATASSFESEDE